VALLVSTGDVILTSDARHIRELLEARGVAARVQPV
jgi:hypothetical protein